MNEMKSEWKRAAAIVKSIKGTGAADEVDRACVAMAAFVSFFTMDTEFSASIPNFVEACGLKEVSR